MEETQFRTVIHNTPPLSIIQRAVLQRVQGLRPAGGDPGAGRPLRRRRPHAALGRAGLEAYGADIEDGARELLGPRFLLADLNQELPWPEATFDAVLSVEGIEHLENRYLFLREARRILRPGGVLIVTTPNIVSLRSRVRFFGSGFYHRDSRPLNESQRQPLHHIGLTTFADLRYALAHLGFLPRQRLGNPRQAGELALCAVCTLDVPVYSGGVPQGEGSGATRAQPHHSTDLVQPRTAVRGEPLADRRVS